MSAALAISMMSFASPSAAVTQEEVDACNASCYNEGGNVPDAARIAGCTQMIGLAQGQGATLSVLFLNRAMAHKNSRNYAQALADANSAVAIAPAEAQNYLIRADIYWSQGDHTRALSDFDEAVRRGFVPRPDDAFYYTARGTSYCRLGQFQQSISEPIVRSASLRSPQSYTRSGHKLTQGSTTTRVRVQI